MKARRQRRRWEGESRVGMAAKPCCYAILCVGESCVLCHYASVGLGSLLLLVTVSVFHFRGAALRFLHSGPRGFYLLQLSFCKIALPHIAHRTYQGDLRPPSAHRLLRLG